MNLTTQIEGWHRYWGTVTDAADVERQLWKLRWLEEFAFHCGPEITAQHRAALQKQIEAGEAKLLELCGDVPKTLENPPALNAEFPTAARIVSSVPESSVSGAAQ